MKIQNLRILNFRGIKEVDLKNLGDVVIVAGQNGSGKSCIFDAIRLLKSLYGGYQHNEWQHWMGEFQVRLSGDAASFTSMKNDAGKELRIDCEFCLAPEERKYIHDNAKDLLRETVWRTILPEAYSWGSYGMSVFAAQFRDREPEVTARVEKSIGQLMHELSLDSIKGECVVPVGGLLTITNSTALPVIFSTFRPKHIGVIDFHGAQRHYGRELVQGINLNLDANEQQRSQSALYNYAAKYNNVKSEMAASYVKDILAEQAGVSREKVPTLTNTLKELFQTFFPEKEFLGPQPTMTGGLSFPVKTSAGNIHDLDELSAGEKEILYGYLRIRNSAPKHSIILLDEPELHLNPRLIRGLPNFYRKNLGQALGNQIWLVTHSDALLREVVGREGYNVFHMLPCGSVSDGESQLKPLSVTADLEMALIDLVGDLAAYRPGGKVVIFEGGGDSDFDRRAVGTLFPELQEKANLISGSNKSKVRALNEILDRASQRGQLPFEFYSITDRDDEGEAPRKGQFNTFSWDVYHLENYFLSPKYISKVLASLGLTSPLSEEFIFDELRECARETMPQLIRHDLAKFANSFLVSAIDVGTDPRAADLVAQLDCAISRVRARLEQVYANSVSKESLGRQFIDIRTKYEQSLADGSWVKIFRGRDILKRFVGKRAGTISYEVFRNLLLSQMRDDGFRPDGMTAIVTEILKPRK